MSRVVVIPNKLRSLGSSLKVNGENIYTLATQLRNVTNTLDWETRCKSNIDDQVNNACNQARNLAAQLQELSLFLNLKADAFEEGDRQSADQMGKLDGIIQQLVSSISNGLTSLTGWLKKLWPFSPITVLPITLLPLLPKIPWPPKVKPIPLNPLPDNPVVPIPTIPVINKPKPPFDKIYIFPGCTFPKYGNNMGSWAGMKHDGIDIRPEPWDENVEYPVSPIGPGRVVSFGSQYYKNPDGTVNYKSGYGNYVIIEHTLADGSKVYSRYAHLAEVPKLTEGQVVGTNPENSNIGIMGSTGKSTAVHVHLEVWTINSDKQKVLEDPLPVISGESNYQFKESPESEDS